jgi:hypothetical protein
MKPFRCLGILSSLAVAACLALAVSSPLVAQSKPAGASPPAAQKKAAPAPNPEQALRARVEKYYSLLQAAQMDEAKKLVSADSRANFNAQPNSRVMAHEIQSVSLAPDGKTASVQVRTQSLGGAAPGPVILSMDTKWKLVTGVWYLSLGGSAATPMSPGTGVSALPPEIKFDSADLSLGTVTADHVEERRVGFTNISDHPLTIEVLPTGSPLFTASVTKTTLQPKEKAELITRFNAVGYYGVFGQTVTLKTQPGGRLAQINVTGDAYLGPPKPAKDKDKP